MKIHTLDLQFQGVPQTIAAYLIESGDHLALIETGPGSTLEALVAALAELGFQPPDISHVFVTHIHLDHAGGAGWWAQQGSKVYVHPRGERHLVDPANLMDSAAMVYGDRMDALWGEMLPAPAENVVAVEDGTTIRIGTGADAIALTAWDTPGHARHHHCWVMEDERIAFVGDAIGVRLGENYHLALTSAPPQFDPPVFDQTLTRLANADFATIYPTHFGAVTDVQDHLTRCREVLWGSAELVRAHIRNGLGRDAICERYKAYCRDRAMADLVSDTTWNAYETVNPIGMCVDGIILYWKRDASSASERAAR